MVILLCTIFDRRSATPFWKFVAENRIKGADTLSGFELCEVLAIFDGIRAGMRDCQKGITQKKDFSKPVPMII
ncbi:MAG: hypothetical protein CXR31_00820 [Geobacter sp.]|nr:MAG: hypothetical protein CXR31_00820 [Geobacter sp.]